MISISDISTCSGICPSLHGYAQVHGRNRGQFIGRLLEHATEYSKALEIRDTDSRVAKAKVAREEIAAELVIFRLEMERYLTVV
jgi:hypothetical protein